MIQRNHRLNKRSAADAAFCGDMNSYLTRSVAGRRHARPTELILILVIVLWPDTIDLSSVKAKASVPRSSHLMRQRGSSQVKTEQGLRVSLYPKIQQAEKTACRPAHDAFMNAVRYRCPPDHPPLGFPRASDPVVIGYPVQFWPACLPTDTSGSSQRRMNLGCIESDFTD